MLDPSDGFKHAAPIDAQPTPEVSSLPNLILPHPSLVDLAVAFQLQIAAFLIISTLALIAVYCRSSSQRSIQTNVRGGARTLLLVGPSAAGKTALFSKLVFGKDVKTVTSMKRNEAVLKTRWRRGGEEKGSEKNEMAMDGGWELPTPVHLIDIPGHPRLRTRSLAEALPAADGLIFVADATGGWTGKGARDAAEHLHILLALLRHLPDTRPADAPRILIFFTKSDLITSSTSILSNPTSNLFLERGRVGLEREMEKRRQAQKVGGAGGTGDHGRGIGAGARLEGLEAIPVAGGGGWFTSLFAPFWGSNPVTSRPGGASLPSDESELLAGDDLAFDGTWNWDKLGLDISWAAGSSRAGDEDGFVALWDWLHRSIL